MFYCQKCADKKKWPRSWVQSYGRCEMCEEKAVCYDTPSKYLPKPENPPIAK